MLTVYSAHGSPGASTTAMYLAAQWASTDTEVLLIEADPGGGSLSHHLGIQFTPGAASFVASGLPVRGGNLIEHSQDVLYNNLHVMPATSSPAGAREIARCWEGQARALREVAETEMAVIIDGGRITADSASAALSAHAAGVVVVARGDSSPTTLQHLGALLSAEACGAGVHRSAVTVGDSALSAEEWAEQCDLAFAGAIKQFPDVSGDLAAFLNRNKRKSKRWRLSLEEVAAELLPYAKPEPGASGQRAAADDGPTLRIVETPPEQAPAPEPAAAPAPEPSAPAPEPTAVPPPAPEPVAATLAHGAYPPEVPGQAPPGAPVEGTVLPPADPTGAPAGDSYEQPAAYAPPETNYAPPPEVDPHYAPAPEVDPRYAAAPQPADPHYAAAPQPEEPYYATAPPAPGGDPHYAPAPPPAAGPPPFAAPPSYPAAPPSTSPHDVAPTWSPPPQPPHPGTFEADVAPPFHQEAPPAGWAPHLPAAPHEGYYPEVHDGAQPLESEQPPAVPPAYDPYAAAPVAPPADYSQAGSAPPADYPQPAVPVAPSADYPPPQPAAQQPPQPAPPPSGSFRDWAARLHTDIPNESSTSGHRGAS